MLWTPSTRLQFFYVTRWHTFINILCGWPLSLALFTDKFFSGVLPDTDYIKIPLSQWQSVCHIPNIYLWPVCVWVASLSLTRFNSSHSHSLPSICTVLLSYTKALHCFTQTLCDTITALKKRTLLPFLHFRLSSKIRCSRHLAMPTKWYWQFPMLS